MSRPKKQIVDYFPHDCSHKKTIFILEQRYGNDGYAFWFKLLEILGSTEGHSLDLNEPEAWEFLQAKTRLDGNVCKEILGLLSKLEAIDKQLWDNKIIWSDNFIDRIAFVYSNRRVDMPVKPINYKHKRKDTGVSTGDNPQSKVKYSKGKESIYSIPFLQFWEVYPNKTGKGKASEAFEKILKRPAIEILIKSIQEQNQSNKWKKDGGQYIPNPVTWLNQRRWEDEVTKEVKPLDKMDFSNVRLDDE